METVLVWLRRDLRLCDHAALHAAAAHGALLPVYVHAPEEEAPWSEGAASRWWRHHSLAALAKAIEARGGRLILRQGPTRSALAALARESGATRILAQRRVEPAVVRRDAALVRALAAEGVTLEVVESRDTWSIPGSMRTQAGAPYRVFTPFWRELRASLPDDGPLGTPRHFAAATGLASLPLDALRLRPTIAWDTGLAEAWTPGEAGAHRMLARFVERATGYARDRDRPDLDASSRLSPHLAFGEITPRQIRLALQREGIEAEKFLAELGWREFSRHLLASFPHTAEQPLDPRFADYPWAASASMFEAWRRGRTGVPLVDAGMRQLWREGWMHNRVRMIVASFLTKNLRGHWLEGARWFWDTLVDADLANNTQGWQWTAGCGADAAPYFRVFNPVAQGERFDPHGDYVRRHVPELSSLPAAGIHRPWMLPASARAGAERYPAAPIVDLATSREAALAGWRSLRAAV